MSLAHKPNNSSVVVETYGYEITPPLGNSEACPAEDREWMYQLLAFLKELRVDDDPKDWSLATTSAGEYVEVLMFGFREVTYEDMELARAYQGGARILNVAIRSGVQRGDHTGALCITFSTGRGMRLAASDPHGNTQFAASRRRDRHLRTHRVSYEERQHDRERERDTRDRVVLVAAPPHRPMGPELPPQHYHASATPMAPPPLPVLAVTPQGPYYYSKPETVVMTTTTTVLPESQTPNNNKLEPGEGSWLIRWLLNI